METKLYMSAQDLLIKGNRITEERVDDIGIIVQLLVHHEGKYAHLGGATVVELDGSLCSYNKS